MRAATFLAPLLAASAVSAAVLRINPRSELDARTPGSKPAVGMVSRGVVTRMGPNGVHQRLVRRRVKRGTCKPHHSSSSSSSPTTASAAPSESPVSSPSEDGSLPPNTDSTDSSSSSTSSPYPYQSSSMTHSLEELSSSTENGTWGQSSTSTDSWASSSTSAWASSSSSDEWSPTSTSSHHSQPTASSTDEWSSSTTDYSSATDSSSTDSSYPSSTTSSAEPAKSSEMTGDGQVTPALIPVQARAFWTTSGGGGTAMEQALKVQSGTLPSVATAPDNTAAMVCNYPAGQIGGSSAMSFYASGQLDNVDVTSATEVVFAYSIFFDNQFDWIKGGKLPGLYGGADFASAKSCSGGSKRDDCFSTRLMWRTDGMGEIYDYIPPSAAKNYCNVPPMSDCNNAYGASIGRGAWNWQKGQWNTVAMRVKLNDAGQANGEQQIWLNGQSVLTVNNLELRLTSDIKFQGIMAQSFFGGSSDDWAPSQEQHAWFKDWTLSIIN